MVSNLILDVGCGDIKRGDVGIDVYRRSEVDIVADAHCLPIRSDCFDGVVSFNLLEHLRNLYNALAEQRRVLKAEGILCLVCDAPYWRWIFGFFNEPGGHAKSFMEELNKHYMLFTEGHLHNLLRDLGFEIIESKPFYSQRMKKLDRIVRRIPWMRHVAYPHIRVKARK